jgi:ankyrin repeat protein
MQKDGNGSTPLHFASGLRGALWQGSVCSQLLKANKGALYQVDNDGLYPIHVAASVGTWQAIALFLKECPSSAGLRDAKGRTVLHVAVENKQVETIYRCMYPWLARIMIGTKCMDLSQQASIVNMQDDDGNTALHLAVESGSLLMFCALFGNRKVDLNITNAKEQTPRDIAKNKVPPAGILFYNQVNNCSIPFRHVFLKKKAKERKQWSSLTW